tara:strand:- start:4578 stop:5366 length:789 start_codon:yes stop_codon:yes gene_type:complete
MLSGLDKPMIFSEIMAKSGKLYAKCFKYFIVWAVLIAAMNMVDKLYAPIPAGLASNHLGIMLGNLSFVVLATMFLGSILTSGMVVQLYHTIHDKELNVKDNITTALHRGVLVFVISLLAAVIAIVLMSVMSLIPVVGQSLSFVIMAYFFVLFFAWAPLTMTQEANIGKSFIMSFKLVRGQWWPTFGIIFMVAIVMVGIDILVSLALGGFNTVAGGQINGGALIANFIITALLTPWAYGVVLLQIENLKLWQTRRDALEDAIK